MIIILIIFFVSVSGCTVPFLSGSSAPAENASAPVNATLAPVHINNTTHGMNQSPTLTPSVNLIGYNNTGLAEPSTRTSSGTTIKPTPVPTFFSTTKGTVSGRVTASDNSGAAGASVSIVDANDHSHILYTTTADSGGYYQFSNVNTTGGQPVYAIYAKHNYLGEGYSYPFMVSQYTVVVSVVVSTNPNNSPSPSTIPTGSVTGKVTTQNTTHSIGGAYVAIVDSSNNSIIYYSGTADSNGVYEFTGIPATNGQSSYSLYAKKEPYGEGRSHEFSVIANSAVITSVVIFTTPTDIAWSGNDTIHAGDSSGTEISLYVTDCDGNPVGDGIQFKLSLSDKSAGTGTLYPATATTKNGYVDIYWGMATKTGTNKITASLISSVNSFQSSMNVYVIP